MSVTGIILAGGQASRFGDDKALFRYQGKRLIEYSIEALEPVSKEILISANQPGRFSFTKNRVVPDVFPGCGPLGGIYSCLLHSSADHHLVVACDLPGIKTELLLEMLERKTGYQAVLPLNQGVLEPLVCYLHRSAAEKIKDALENKRYRLSTLFDNLNCCFVEASAFTFYTPTLFANINRMTDLEQFNPQIP